MRKTPEFEQCFAELIAIPSVSSIDPAHDQSNRAIVDKLATYFEALGFSIQFMSIDGQPGKSNLIARRGNGEAGQGLVLSGHTDTVPYDEKGWASDPFTLTRKDNRYYGLGTADMKSFFPIILETLERLSGVEFQKPITLVATADEESTMSGVRAIKAEAKPLGRHCIIGEPTGLVPRYMHKGIIIENIYLEGRSGHSSDPGLGISALEGMNEVMNALRSWRDALQAENRNTEFKIPAPTLNLGRIQGGDSANRICANCELAIDLRVLPGMNLEKLRDNLQGVVRQAVSATGLKVKFNSLFDGTPPMLTPLESEIIKMSEEFSETDASSVAFGTEGPFFNDMGTETVILGPGDIEVAHQANEYLQIDRIEPMITILSKMLIHFCEGK